MNGTPPGHPANSSGAFQPAALNYNELPSREALEN